MSAAPAIEWPAEGNARVPYRVFSDPEIYREELARIFLGSTWQFLSLASELPEPGDYLTTFLGETPVIVTRGNDGALNAMVNRCAHRGNLVCLKRRGHADNLTCVYHAWRYDLAGNLDSIAFRRGIAGKGGMPAGFRLEEHGLKKLRVELFGDLVFGTLSSDAPPLGDYIGNLMGWRIHRVLHGTPKVLGTASQILNNNWKLYFGNVRDTYHATLLHSFFTTFRMSRLTSEGGVDIAEGGAHHASYTRNKIDRVGAAASDQLYAGIPSLRENFRLADPGFLSMIEEFGDDTTTQILSLFPNFVLQQIQNSIVLRLVLPKGPDKTELQWIYLGFEEDDDAMTALRLAQANLVGPAGYVSMEDGAVGNFIQRASAPRRRKRVFGARNGRVRPRLRGQSHHRGVDPRLLAKIPAADGILIAGGRFFARNGGTAWISRQSHGGCSSRSFTAAMCIVSTPTGSKTGLFSSPRMRFTG
jgi:phenylpropionate dioxygenase-like ring-hydroxylating dioxygenase large terminal subunit